MEQILRRRYPNSLPALMLAAATVPDAAQPSGDGRSRTVEVLEKRIKKLEGELEKKDEESATLLRGMEQKYNAVKVGVTSVGVCVCWGQCCSFLCLSLWGVDGAHIAMQRQGQRPESATKTLLACE